MSYYREADLSFWLDPDFEKASFLLKSFYQYLYQNLQSNLIGVYLLHKPTMAAQTNLSIEEIDSLLKILAHPPFSKIVLEKSWIWIKGMGNYVRGVKQIQGAKVLWRELPDHLEIKKEFSLKYKNLLADTLSIGYPATDELDNKTKENKTKENKIKELNNSNSIQNFSKTETPNPQTQVSSQLNQNVLTRLNLNEAYQNDLEFLKDLIIKKLKFEPGKISYSLLGKLIQKAGGTNQLIGAVQIFSQNEFKNGEDFLRWFFSVTKKSNFASWFWEGFKTWEKANPPTLGEEIKKMLFSKIRSP